MNEELLKQINSNIRYLLLVMTLETLPETTKYAALKKMGFTSSEISEFTGIPVSTVKRWWNPKDSEENKNDKSK